MRVELDGIRAKASTRATAGRILRRLRVPFLQPVLEDVRDEFFDIRLDTTDSRSVPAVTRVQVSARLYE